MTTLTSAEQSGRPAPKLEVTAGRLGNLSNLLRKELGQWWGTRMWWVQLLIWVLLTNFITTVIALTEEMVGEALLQEVLGTFLGLIAGVTGLAIVIIAQDAIIGEKQSGTAAWVMSKPASRSAFVVSKLIGYALGFWVTSIIAPALVFAFISRLTLAMPPDLSRFPAALALLALGQLFYLTLTLMLGAFFSSRAPVAGIGVGFILVGLTMRGFLPAALVMLTPWWLPDIGAAITMGQPLPGNWYVPIVATAGWTVLFAALALWRFSREEF